MCVCARAHTCVRGSCPSRAALREAPPSPLPLRAEPGSPEPRNAKTASRRQKLGAPGTVLGGASLPMPCARAAGREYISVIDAARLCCFVKVAPGPSSGARSTPLVEHASARLTAPTGPPHRPTPRLQILCRSRIREPRSAAPLLPRALSKWLTSGSGPFPGALHL